MLERVQPFLPHKTAHLSGSYKAGSIKGQSRNPRLINRLGLSSKEPDVVVAKGLEMIHVKHVPDQNRTRDSLDSRETSLADTKVPKDHIKKIFNIDAAGDTPKRVSRPAKIFSPQFSWKMGRGNSRRKTLNAF